ncbi:MAG: sigma-54-dependent Fis family transcriptional regulator [Candidatus Hydrogenedentes bacterium]|nr:sigma-54-dependent Fis family transcriptional regulator [Candidatus Hydrogenedentota bacterium]MBI3119581.1 sigma-54-dependent Fis family transcriptional regulator [Candidatus Hydrogenedentota bacterium]
MKNKILVTEDDQVQREIITDILRLAGNEVRSSASAEEALAVLREDDFEVLLTDMKMPGMDGLELLRQAKRLRADLEVVVMTAHASVKTAVTAIREGAADYLEKPFDKDELILVVNRTLERRELRHQNRQLRELVTEAVSLGNIVGESPAMQRVFERVQRAIRVNSTVMILGESGTGKELIARHIHFAGPRQNKSFIVVNCAAIPENLVESELFGHEKGAFTGADASRPGKFEAADGGTIFLDEIGDMRLESQAKLLRVLQDGTVERVGSIRPRQVDVRVIVATNRDLRDAVAEGEFREDLYFRLEVLPIALPPLRERMQDLPMLIGHFRDKLAKKLGIKAPALSPDVLDAFRRYRWPGNVRELEHTLEQVFVLSEGEIVTTADLPEKLRSREQASAEYSLPPAGVVLEELEQELIRQALERSGGSIKEAAPLLGLTYKTLQYRLKKHEIDRKNPEV